LSVFVRFSCAASSPRPLIEAADGEDAHRVLMLRMMLSRTDVSVVTTSGAFVV
jgi:hypothetical protein